MRKTSSLEKTLTLGKIEGRRRRGQQRMRSLDGVTDGTDMSLSRICRLIRDREAWCAGVHGVAKSRIRLSNWTQLKTVQPPSATEVVGHLGKITVLREHGSHLAKEVSGPVTLRHTWLVLER